MRKESTHPILTQKRCVVFVETRKRKFLVGVGKKGASPAPGGWLLV